MFEKLLITDSLPIGKIPQVEMEIQSEAFIENNILINLVDSLSQMLVILNSERQIIYANKPYLEFCGFSDPKSVVGKRPGEVLNCRNAFLIPDGCGTTEYCKSCGAAKAISESKFGVQSTRECQVFTANNESLDFRITATPYEYPGQDLTIFALIDISDEKRRESLERVFFHDILNSAGGISGLSSILKEIDNKEEIIEIADTICQAADNLVDEIQMQRQLSEAERGELKPDFKKVNSLSVLKDVKCLYSMHQVIVDKTIIIDEKAENFIFNTDPVLLRRVLSNMIKNALEVNDPKAHIILSCESKTPFVQFSVHNTKYIEQEVQQKLFKKSFTTKEMGSGLGTYSMKLLGEKYLNGKVWFESSIEKGTTFFIQL